MTLYARPSRLEHEVSHKVRSILRVYQKTMNMSGDGAGSTITIRSYMYFYLLGAKSALDIISDSEGQVREFKKDLEAILTMVEKNGEVYFEDK